MLLKVSCSLIAFALANGDIDRGGNFTIVPNEGSRGIVVCSGEGDMFIESITMIEHTRSRSQSTLPITVVHCSELSKESIAILKLVDNVKVMDLCSSDHGQFSSVRPRLKGFFCKPAALLASPFTHTILADTDVVWFQKPELLFDSPRYMKTGTLFFRDRWTQTKNKLTLTRATHQASDILNFVRSSAMKVRRHFAGSHPVLVGNTSDYRTTTGTTSRPIRKETQQQQEQQGVEESVRVSPAAPIDSVSRQKPSRKFANKQQQQQQQSPTASGTGGGGKGSGAPVLAHKLSGASSTRKNANVPTATIRNRRLLVETDNTSSSYSTYSGQQLADTTTSVKTGKTSYSHSHGHRHLEQQAGQSEVPVSVRNGGRRIEHEQLASKNAFWRHLATGKGFTPDHWQDSSVVLFHAKSHPHTTYLLHHILRDFSIGYGDKEMYWLAATAAEEPFAFEPHIAGSLGDCGALVHFDPRVDFLPQTETNSTGPGTIGSSYESSSSSSTGNGKYPPVSDAKPFYINAEYLTDFRKITKTGQFLSSPHNELTKPRFMDETKTDLFILKPWKNQEHGFYPCGSCVSTPCSPADDHTVIDEIKFRQKFMLALKEARDRTPNKRLTVDIYVAVRKTLAGELRGPTT